ncbi:sphingomyelin phosphodiesterase [Gracilaria domingensis]|nr:sphingomyelin phosphodiesterase [Gracilaria domingensis]
MGSIIPKESALRDHTLSIPSINVLRFMTLNVFIRPIGIGIDDYKDSRLRDLLKEMGSFDVICFQELFTASGFRKAQFLRKLDQLYGFKYYVTSPSPGIKGLLSFPPKLIDGGLVIASRFEILQADYITFSRATTASIDTIVAKGVLYAGVAVPAPNNSTFLVHVFTTHMQANNGLDVDFGTTRQSQLRELVEFVIQKTSEDPSRPIILAGDFNVDGRLDFDHGSSSVEYAHMIEVLNKVRPISPLRDILYDTNGRIQPVTSAGGLSGDNQKNERLDYIFFSPGTKNATHSLGTVKCIEDSVRAEPWKISGRPYRTLSDHFAVIANFEIGPTDNDSGNP